MKRLILTTSLCVLFVAGTAIADWDPGDPHKMETAQLPNMNGWDISWGPRRLGPDFWQWEPRADDWRCPESGPVSDIHFWYSWQMDQQANIDQILVQITDNDDRPDDYDRPGDILWSTMLYPGDFTTREYGTGDQGFYFPWNGQRNWNDHDMVYQVNIEDIADPFYQYEGNIYWLVVNVYTSPTPEFSSTGTPHMGWKTSGQGTLSNAVYSWEGGWYPIPNPETLTWPQDLAFVIAPEPTTIVLLGLGGLLLRKKRRA